MSIALQFGNNYKLMNIVESFLFHSINFLYSRFAIFAPFLMAISVSSFQFMRSRVNGSRGSCVQFVPESDADKTLLFESRFESGNLGRVVQV